MLRLPLPVTRLFAATVCVWAFCVLSSAQVTVRSVKVLGAKDAVEIEVEASDRIVPQTQLLTGPDRLVIDFANSVPSKQVSSQSVDRGQVKDIRVGLFQAKPPITRVVLDLKAAQSYQIFPYGRTLMIKVSGAETAAISAAHIEPVSVPAPPEPLLEVTYHDGLLGVRANKATLSEVLTAIQQRTGADIPIPPGAEQEKVVAAIEPAPAPEVLARLLNGSMFNFLILSSPDDWRKLDRVILTARTTEYVPPLPMAENAVPAPDSTPVPNPPDVAAAPVQPPPVQPPPVPPNPGDPSAPNQ
jgi:hypothetical protein